MNDIKFSIIVPVYNVERYLDKCIVSLVEQTYKPYEIILVDDGSTDNSNTICKQYADKYPEIIRLIHQENKRQGAARNNGVQNACGDYIMFVDSDDYLDLKTLQNIAIVLSAKKYDIVGFDLFTVNENGKRKSRQDLSCGIKGEIEYKQDVAIVPTIPVCKAYRLEWYKKIECSFPEEIIYEDVAVVPYLMASANSIYFFDKAFYYYVQHKSSTMHRKIDDRTLDILKSNKCLIIRFKEKNLYDDYCDEIENVAVKTILFQLFEIINEEDYTSKYQDSLIDFMESTYPHFLDNKYLSRSEKERITLIKKRDYKTYNRKYIIKKKIKRVLSTLMPEFVYNLKNKLREVKL